MSFLEFMHQVRDELNALSGDIKIICFMELRYDLMGICGGEKL